jgi:hypothetical protein
MNHSQRATHERNDRRRSFVMERGLQDMIFKQKHCMRDLPRNPFVRQLHYCRHDTRQSEEQASFNLLIMHTTIFFLHPFPFTVLSHTFVLLPSPPSLPLPLPLHSPTIQDLNHSRSNHIFIISIARPLTLRSLLPVEHGTTPPTNCANLFKSSLPACVD